MLRLYFLKTFPSTSQGIDYEKLFVEEKYALLMLESYLGDFSSVKASIRKDVVLSQMESAEPIDFLPASIRDSDAIPMAVKEATGRAHKRQKIQALKEGGSYGE